MRLPFFIIFLLGYSLAATAQITVKLYEDKSYINKLEQQYAKSGNDSIKASLAFKLCYTYKRAKNIPKAQLYLEKGVQLSKNNSFLKAIAYYYQAYVSLGSAELQSIKHKAAKADSLLSRFDHAEAYRIRSNAWLMRGLIEQMSSNEQKGLDAYINHAIPLAKKSGDNFAVAIASKFVGISLLNANERKRADLYLQNALDLFEKSSTESEANKKEAIVETSLILAENNVYMDLNSAKKYLDKANEILKKYPKSNAYLFYYFPEGMYYMKKGRYREALLSFDKGIALHPGVMENFYINRTKFAKFETLREMKEYPKAIKVIKDLLKSPILLDGDRSRYYNLIASTYAGAGNMREAYEWSRKHIAINDSLQTNRYQKDMVEMEQKYQSAEKEKQIMLLLSEKKESELRQKNQRLLNWLFGIGAMIFLLALLLLNNIYKNYRRNHLHKIKDLEQQKELQVAQALLKGEERERQRIGRDLHDGLGGVLSVIKIKLSQQKTTALPAVDEAVLQLDDAITELQRIARNMMPETLFRSGLETALKDLCVSMSSNETLVEFQANGIGKNIPVQLQVDIYRIIQELLSNAVRHGKATKIIVQCIQNGSRFFITVEDNGCGFNILKKDQTKGIGLSNIQNRISLRKGSMVLDTDIDNGTTINIELYV